jgi:hypothetical protein
MMCGHRRGPGCEGRGGLAGEREVWSECGGKETSRGGKGDGEISAGDLTPIVSMGGFGRGLLGNLQVTHLGRHT